MKTLKKTIVISLLLLNCMQLFAQEAAPAAPHQGPSEEEIKRANDPMAHVKAFNTHNYIVSKLYGTEAQANQLIFRYSQPLGKFLLRASMPVITSSAPEIEPVTGFGDFNMFAIYAVPFGEGNKIGIGPNITAPTGSHGLGSGKWQAGVSAIAFFAKSRVVQAGGLLQYSLSFAGDDDREDISLLTPQLFFIWQVGAGFNFRSTGIWSFNLENGDYSVPIGLGAGKVIKAGNVVFNIFCEPQFTVAAQGVGQPKFQTFIGFNTQF